MPQRPRRAAIRSAVDAARGRRDNRVRVSRADRHLEEARAGERAAGEKRPSGATVGRFEHAESAVGIAGKISLARADVNHIGIARRDRNGASGERGLAIGDRRPACAGISRPPDSSSAAANKPAIHVGGIGGDRRDASRHRTRGTHLAVVDRGRPDVRPQRSRKRVNTVVGALLPVEFPRLFPSRAQTRRIDLAILVLFVLPRPPPLLEVPVLIKRRVLPRIGVGFALGTAKRGEREHEEKGVEWQMQFHGVD